MNDQRIYYLDWLRFIVVALLVPFHAALTFTGQGETYVYHEGIKGFYMGISSAPAFTVPLLETFVDFLDKFFMHLLFLIAGFSSVFTIQRKSIAGFLTERFKKLLIPLIMGTLLYIPVTSWLRNISLFEFHGSFFQFYPNFFNGIRGTFPKANFEWGHLWFLAYLFVFTLMAAPLFQKLRKGKILSRSYTHKQTRFFLFTFFLFLLFLEALLRPFWPGFQNLYNDWANFSNYLFIYILGFIIGSNQSLRKSLKVDWKYYISIGILSYIALFIIKKNGIILTPFRGSTHLYILFRTLQAYSLILGLIGLGEAKLNRDHSLLNTFRSFSFPLYVLHFIPLSLFSLLFLRTEMPIGMQYICTVILSYPSIYLLYRLIIYIPVIKISLGAKELLFRRQIS